MERTPIYEGGLFEGLHLTWGAYVNDSNLRGEPISRTPIYEGGLFQGLQFTRGAYLKDSNLRGEPI